LHLRRHRGRPPRCGVGPRGVGCRK
jgi:hypothetical protein